MNQRWKGTSFAALAAVIYGLIPLFSLSIYGNGGDVFSVSCIRSSFALFVHGGMTVRRGISLKVTQHELVQLVLVAVFGITGTDFFLGQSYNYISGGLATTLHFIYPAACIVVGAAFFRERVTPCSIGALVCVMSGIAMFSWRNVQTNALGISFALISGLCYTFYLVMLAQSQLKEMPINKVMFYICLIETILCGGLALQNHSFAMNASGWLLAILLSVLVNVTACSLLQLGVRLVGLPIASMLSTLEPLTSVLAGVLIFQDAFGLVELGGCTLVCIGIVILMRNKT